MNQVFTTVSTKGQLVIPASFRQSLGIEPGTRVTICLDGSRLILVPQTKDTARQLLDELCGITAGGYSMADDLIAERRAEDENAGW